MRRIRATVDGKERFNRLDPCGDNEQSRARLFASELEWLDRKLGWGAAKAAS